MSKILTLICCLLLMCSSAMAQQVRISGQGTTPQEAENDALRMAVEQAVGTMVSSQTVMEKNTILQDTVYSNSRGFVNNYQVLERMNMDGTWYVTLVADVDTNPDSRLMDALTKEGLVQRGMHGGSIAVIITGPRYGEPNEPILAANTIINVLMENGFNNIVDTSKNRFNQNYPYDMNTAQLQALASTMRADVLVVGRVSSEQAGDVGKFINGSNTGMLSSKAQLDAKVYTVYNGQILAAEGQSASGLDITRSTAAHKAVENAARAAGQKLADKLLALFGSNGQLLQLQATASGGFAALNQLQQEIAALPGVKSVELTDYKNNTGYFTIGYPGSALQLFKLLEQESSLLLEEKALGHNNLQLVVH